MEVVSADLFPRVLRRVFFYWLKLRQLASCLGNPAGFSPTIGCSFAEQPLRSSVFPSTPPPPGRAIPEMKLRSKQQATIPLFQNHAIPMVLPTQDSMPPLRNPLKSVRILMASRLRLDFLGQGLPEPVQEDNLLHNLISSFRLFLNLIDFMSFPLAANSQYPFWLLSHLSSPVHYLSDCPLSAL